MKQLHALRIFLFAMVMAVAVSGTAVAGSQDFTLINGTGRTITNIYLSPNHLNSWVYQDELGSNVLRPGQDLFIYFDPMDNVQYWDVKVVYENGDEEYWYGLDLYRVYTLTIRPGGVSSIEMA